MNSSPILNQRNSAVVQVVALVHPLGVDAAVDADHQVERQFEVGAAFRERPEHEVAQVGLPLGIGLCAQSPHGLQRRGGRRRGNLRRREVGRQRNRAGAGAVGDEMLEQRGDRSFQRGRVVHRAARRLIQPGAYLALRQVEHQIVGAQAGDVHRRVEAGKRVVEVVGQKHSRQFAALQYLFGPVRPVHGHGGLIVERFPVGAGDRVGLEAEENLGHFQQPARLDRVFDRAQVFDQATDLLLRVQAWLFDPRTRHAGRMGQLGVVVIAQNVGQSRRSRRVRVDVRVRIDQLDGVQSVKQACTKLSGHGVKSRGTGVGKTPIFQQSATVASSSLRRNERARQIPEPSNCAGNVPCKVPGKALWQLRR